MLKNILKKLEQLNCNHEYEFFRDFSYRDNQTKIHEITLFCPICKKTKYIDKFKIENCLNKKKESKSMIVGELKEFISDLPEDMEIYITSNDNMPIKIVKDISAQERVGYYKELYLEVENLGKG